jgi:hypothetical protein
VNGSRAVASIPGFSIQLFTIAPQAIYSEYTLTTSNNTINIDISPSGNYAVVAACTHLILYQITQTAI